MGGLDAMEDELSKHDLSRRDVEGISLITLYLPCIGLLSKHMYSNVSGKAAKGPQLEPEEEN